MSHHGFNVQWLFNAHAGASDPDERVLDAAWWPEHRGLPAPVDRHLLDLMQRALPRTP